MERSRALRQLKALKKLGMPMRLAADGWKEEWMALLSIMLSARTRDETTIRVSENLFKRFRTVRALARATSQEVESLIRPVNFYKNKARAVLGCARSLIVSFAGKPPHVIDELVTLPSVGRKTANVFLAQYGTSAIGVDTHVAYVARTLGWTRNLSADKIEKDLEHLFPKRMWRAINVTCVQFGKTHLSRTKKKELLDYVRSH